MSLAAVAVRNQRRRAAQQQQLTDDALTQNTASQDPNLKLRKVRLISSPVPFFSLSTHGAGVPQGCLRDMKP